MKTRLTFKEAFTIAVVGVVLAAVAVPMWRTHKLRVRRDDAAAALRAVQAAQDDYFGRHARYADEAQLRESAPKALAPGFMSPRGYYQVSLKRSADELTYTATARIAPRLDQTNDTRCVELSIDQNGRRFAVDAAGGDRSADCWR